MAIINEITSEADRKLAEHVLILFRGLKLSGDLDLAESAIRAERELTDKIDKLNGNGKGKGAHHRRELAHA